MMYRCLIEPSDGECLTCGGDGEITPTQRCADCCGSAVERCQQCGLAPDDDGGWTVSMLDANGRRLGETLWVCDSAECLREQCVTLAAVAFPSPPRRRRRRTP